MTRTMSEMNSTVIGSFNCDIHRRINISFISTIQVRQHAYKIVITLHGFHRPCIDPTSLSLYIQDCHNCTWTRPVW